MSAYNRNMLVKMCSNAGTFDVDSAMDESGYASFKAQHNSTVEAPFLFERDCETENCRNASNTTAPAAASIRLQKSTFNSMQFQTPCASSVNEFNSNSTAPLWHQALSFPTASGCAHRESVGDDGDDGMCKSPLPISLSFSNVLPCASKRRKTHFQTIAHHSSPKKSKKKLFPQPSRDFLCRTRYYDGIDRLDIIGMLINTVPALELILTNLNSHTLDVMTKVSERWAQAIYKSRRATERLENHRFKLSLTKENIHAVKRGQMLSKSNNHIVPLQISNAIHKPYRHDFSRRNVSPEDNCQLVEQLQRIKCPRCNKSSKVFTSSQQQPAEFSTHAAPLSQTLPHTYSFSEGKPTSLKRFFSLDEVKSSPDESDHSRCTGKSESFTFGECTSILCKFRFCVNCYCPPHPGEKCLVTEMGTPSKVMMPSERITPPKRTPKYDSKLSRKKSLKRLNF